MYITYIIKIWLATMVSAPIVFIGLVLMIDADLLALYPIMELLIFVIFVGFVYSIPTLLCVGLLSNFLLNRIENTKTLKVIGILLSISGVIGTFLLIGPGTLDDGKEYTWGLTLAFLYCLFVVIFGMVFKIKMKFGDE